MSTTPDDQPLSRRELRERQQAQSRGNAAAPRRVSTDGPVAAPAEPAPITAPLNTVELRKLLEVERSGATLTRRQLRDLDRARAAGALPGPAASAAPGSPVSVRDEARDPREVIKNIAAATGAEAGAATPSPAPGTPAAPAPTAEQKAAAVRAQVEAERVESERTGREKQAAARARAEKLAEEKVASEKAARAAEKARAEKALAEKAAAAKAEAERASGKRGKKKPRRGSAEKAEAELAAEAEQRAAEEAAEAERAEGERAAAAARAAEEAEAEEAAASAAALANSVQAGQERIEAAAQRALDDIRPGGNGNVDETQAFPRLSQAFGSSVGDKPAPGTNFDAILGRGVDETGGTTTAGSALILPALPGAGPLTGPIGVTGEVLITGTIDLPDTLSSTGQHTRGFDKAELDTMFDHDEDPQPATAGNPVSASRAVSSHTATRDVIAPPAPAKNNRLLLALSITVGVLAVAVVVVVIVAIANGTIGTTP